MKKVLIVDDSPSVRQQVRLALEGSGYSVVEAVDGVDGVEQITNDTAHDIGMVICDVNMPRMNGLELVETVSRGDRAGSLPIVMLTTEGQPALIKRAKQAGAKGWIVKPFKGNLLVGAVKKLLAK